MSKEQFEIQAMDFISGNMSENEKREFENFLDSNPEYKTEFMELSDTWKDIDALDAPRPSEEMDETFFSMLNEEVGRTKRKNPSEVLMKWISIFLKPQLAYGILLLGIGFGLGFYINSANNSDRTTAIVVNEETEDVRQKLVLTLLDQPSANQRLQGVSEANKIDEVDETVIKALLQTLNRDSNVNVRLAAVESLTNYVGNPLVRQGLVQSIPYQESPILQITLANLMVALQEKASIEPFKQLLQEKELDTTVQKKIKKSIESII